MQGQANHFTRYAPSQMEYGISRYQNETRRLYSVLEKHLKDTNAPYICGDKCTIADIAHWGWIALAAWAGVDIDEFPALKAWDARMDARPAVQRGRDVPDKWRVRELLADRERMEEHARKGRELVQEGMREDAKRKG